MAHRSKKRAKSCHPQVSEPMECDTQASEEDTSNFKLVTFLEEPPTKFRAQETAVNELLELDKVQDSFGRSHLLK